MNPALGKDAELVKSQVEYQNNWRRGHIRFWVKAQLNPVTSLYNKSTPNSVA